MTEEQQAAYVNAMAAQALIRAMGMQAENLQAIALEQPIAFGKKDFDALVEECGIHHNAVLGSFGR